MSKVANYGLIILTKTLKHTRPFLGNLEMYFHGNMNKFHGLIPLLLFMKSKLTLTPSPSIRNFDMSIQEKQPLLKKKFRNFSGSVSFTPYH